MRLFYSSLFVVLLAFTALAENELSKTEKQKILSVLDKQIEAWNEGNLKKFMKPIGNRRNWYL